MKKLSTDKLVNTILTLRKAKNMTQAQLSEATGINRAMIGRIENKDYVPTIDQLQNLAEVLGFDVVDLFVDDTPTVAPVEIEKPAIKPYNIAVAGTGYVGQQSGLLVHL